MIAAQIALLAYNAGVRGQSNLQAATAIALAESGGNPNAIGDVGLENATWGPSVGLWQIRSAKAETGKGSSRDVNQLKDPAFNAKSMFSISGGGKNWGPWSTWPVKAALFMPAAAIAANGVSAGETINSGVVEPVTGAVDATAGTIGDIGTGVKATYRWISDRNNWFRILKVTIGGTILVVGIGAVARSTDTGKAVIANASKAAGVAAKAAAV